MCIILFAINSHPDYPFVVAANRDEFYARPTKKIDWWSDYSHVLGARDQADVLGLPGTALGLSQKGKFSAITNIRAPSEKNPDLRTRGELTAKFLSQSKPIHEFITDHQKSFLQYNGFNLLLGDLSNVARPEFFWVSNRLLVGDKIRQRKTINPTAISAGLYGLSNAMLDTPWPKVRSGVAQFAQALARDSGKFNQLESWTIDREFNLTTVAIQPNLTILFDISPEEAEKRRALSRNPDKFEALNFDFFNRVRAEYLRRVKEDPMRFEVIDASQSIKNIQKVMGNIATKIELYI